MGHSERLKHVINKAEYLTETDMGLSSIERQRKVICSLPVRDTGNLIGQVSEKCGIFLQKTIVIYRNRMFFFSKYLLI